MAKPLTLALAKTLNYGDYLCSLKFKKRDGGPVVVKVNGVAKTWKRSPERVQVPWKYGLYEFGYVTESDLGDWVPCGGMGTPWTTTQIAERLLEGKQRAV